MVLGINKVYRITLKLKDVTLKNNLAERDYHQDEINQNRSYRWPLKIYAVESLGSWATGQVLKFSLLSFSFDKKKIPALPCASHWLQNTPTIGKTISFWYHRELVNSPQNLKPIIADDKINVINVFNQILSHAAYQPLATLVYIFVFLALC